MSPAEQQSDLEPTPPRGTRATPPAARWPADAPDAPSGEGSVEPDAPSADGPVEPDTTSAEGSVEPDTTSAEGSVEPDAPSTEDPVEPDAPSADGPVVLDEESRARGPAGGEPGSGVGPGGHLIRTVDFSQPTKFTAELRRRIVRALGSFCEAYRAEALHRAAGSSRARRGGLQSAHVGGRQGAAVGEHDCRGALGAADQSADAALHRAPSSCRRSNACSAATPPRPPPNGASAKSTGRSPGACCNP